MSFKTKFNDNYKARKYGDAVLSLQINTYGGTNYLAYDFNARVLHGRTGASERGLTVTPFSQLDPESLVAMREKLIELGGDPPELPAPSRPAPPASGGMNL